MNLDLDTIKNIFPQEVLDSIAEIQQPRSKFQIEKFVVNQHDTSEMQYYQVLLEIQSLYDSLKSASFDYRKNEIRVKRLKESGDEIDAIDAEQIEYGMEQTKMIAYGAVRELEHLLNIYNSFPVKYSREQIEIAQPEYWSRRLTRQINLDMIGNGSSVNPANLEALRQIGQLENFVSQQIEFTNNDVKEIEGEK